MTTRQLDLHIHTALSPCADDDMTPCNVANMAVLAGLDGIAVTDHNSVQNAAAVIAAAKRLELPLLVIPGVEAESSEEIHITCLFPDMAAAEAFGAWLVEGMPQIPNKPGIFGEQLIMDAFDNVTGSRQTLLSTASARSLNEIADKAAALGGAAVPAHIDRESNGVLAVLGTIPEDLNVAYVELSKRCDPQAFLAKRPELLKYGFTRASDAHRLFEIGECPWVWETGPDEALTVEAVITALSHS